MDLTGIYKTFCSTTTEYTFFSAAHGMFSTTDHILGYIANFNKCRSKKKTEIISCILPVCNTIKLEINREKIKPRNSINTWRWNNSLLKDQLGHWRNQGETKKLLESNKYTILESLGCIKREVYGYECLHQKSEISNNLITHLEVLEKQEQIKPESNGRKE